MELQSYLFTTINNYTYVHTLVCPDPLGVVCTTEKNSLLLNKINGTSELIIS